MSDKELKFIYKEPTPPPSPFWEVVAYIVGIMIVFGLMYMGGR